MPRFFLPFALAPDTALSLPPDAARHAQVLRLQPGDSVTLFNGQGGEWSARITQMGRKTVDVQVQAQHPHEREAPRPVHLAVGLMSSERLDWLVEKATELGAISLTPLATQRSSLRLSDERAAKKRAHWQAVAVAASEQCGRNRLLAVQPPQPLLPWLAQPPVPAAACWVLSLADDAAPLASRLGALPAADTPVVLLSGPEGGLSPEEEAAARASGWQPVRLGGAVLRAETAPLAALARLTL